MLYKVQIHSYKKNDKLHYLSKKDGALYDDNFGK